MRGRFAPYIVGIGLLNLAAVMLVFCVYAALLDESIAGFAVTLALSTAFGGVLIWLGTSDAEPTRREALIGVLLLWLAVPAFSAVPYIISGGFSPLDAMFESMSGFTTTGATVLRSFDDFPKSLFMWRALTQWVGGVGIIVLFIAVFPQLAIAGRQLFFAEAPGPTDERLTPRLRNTAGAVLIVYVGLSVLCALAYWLVGMTPYDAVAHSFTTLAAGGFSPNGLSFEGFDSAATDWVAILFMTFAGANFALQYRAVAGRPGDLFRDAELRAYLTILLGASALLTFILREDYAFFEALRHALFQVISIATTTGYASVDFVEWSQQGQAVLLVLMFIGGSAGSAAGGVKVVRWLIITRNMAREVRHSLHPRAVLPVQVGGRPVSEEVLRAVAAFLTLYMSLFAVIAVIVILLGADIITGVTASIACLGNVGPGLGEVGPMLNFADLHPVSRGLLAFAMYAGRLEVVTVFIIFNRDFWRLPKRGAFQRRRL